MSHIRDIDFVFIGQDIPQDLMYTSPNNFTGAIVDGYISKHAIATKRMAQALRNVQAQLNIQGFSLLVKDTYRPHRSVSFFNTIWKDLPDNLEMKKLYYPKYKKEDLFQMGYIAKKYSRHSSGSTVDLTIIDLKVNQELDMGTPVDFLGEESNIDFPDITELQQNNRRLLRTTMKENGFKEMTTEWWHFTLIDEPYPNQAFDFVCDDNGCIISGSVTPIYW